jgi:hypothetical protein
MLRKASKIAEPRLARLKARSRRVILWSFGLFLFSQIATSVAIDHWILNDVDGLFGEKAKLLEKRLSEDEKDSLLVIALGSSRTMWGWEAAPVERQLESALGRPVIAFNYGNLGNGPLAQWVVLRRLIEREITPDLVLLEITPAFFTNNSASPRAARSGLNLMRIRAKEMPLLAEYGLTKYVAGSFARGWFAPFHHHRGDILAALAPAIAGQRGQQGLNLDPWGSQIANRVRGNPRQYQRALDIAMSTFARPYLRDYRLGGVSVRILEDMLADCQERRIATGLVVIPEGTPLRSMYQDRWPEVEEWLTSLEQRFGCPVVNAREWVDDEGFWDGHHMCRSGARVYTDRFCKEAVPRLVDSLGSVQMAEQSGKDASR